MFNLSVFCIAMQHGQLSAGQVYSIFCKKLFWLEKDYLSIVSTVDIYRLNDHASYCSEYSVFIILYLLSLFSLIIFDWSAYLII